VRRLLYAQVKARIIGADGRSIRLVAPFVDDPKRGADYGLFRRLVCGFSIELDTLHMIVDAFTREMDRRYDALASNVWEDDEGRLWEGEKLFDPTTMGPVMSLTIDEFHERAKDPSLMAKLDPFGRKMRAAGIEVNMATHLGTIGDTGSQGFRDMTAGGEAWLLRTTLALTASLVTGGQLVGDPRALPREPGMLLHAAGEAATMRGRAAFDEPAVMYDALYERGPARVSKVQPVEWPAETLEAFGKDFVAWMRDCQESPIGTSAPGVPKALQTAVPLAGKRDLSAERALRQIMFESPLPLGRQQVLAHRLWEGRGVTSTLTDALKTGVTATPPWLVKLDEGRGLYELSPAMRVHMQQAIDESKESA
jgi:hypothetical protein